MPIAFRCGLDVPMWAVAFSAIAFGAPQRVMPFLMTLLAVGVIASTMPAMVRRFSPPRRSVQVFPALDDQSPPAEIIITARRGTRTLDAAIEARQTTVHDATDLVRMDDDGGWQMTRHSAADGAVPTRNQRLR